MPTFALRRLAPLLLALAVAACSGDATAPIAEEAEFAPAELDLASMDRGDAAPPETDRHIPTLQRLLHQAIRTVHEEQGAEAARRLLMPVRRLLAEARAAHEAGHPRVAHQKLHEANVRAAHIVVQVLGPQVVQRLHGAVGSGLQELVRRIEAMSEAGEDVTRLTRVATTIHTLARGAAQLADAGAWPRALLLNAHAHDLLWVASRM